VFCYNPNEIQPGIGSQESRRLIQPLNRLNNMLQCDPRNSSTYHSGQLKITQRFSGGLQFLVSYTYGKALDYGGSAASGGGAVGNPQTVTNLQAGHGPSGFDVRHRGVISGVWELPWGPNPRWLREGGVLGLDVSRVGLNHEIGEQLEELQGRVAAGLLHVTPREALADHHDS